MTVAGQPAVAYTYDAADRLVSLGQAPSAPGAVTIYQGWNLISVPVQDSALHTVSGLVSSLTASLGSGSVKVVSIYNNGRFSVYVPGYSPDQPLTASEGVFVLTTTSGTWSPSGNPYSSGQPADLHPGWNLVAAPYPGTGLNGSDINAQIGPTCSLQEVVTYTGSGYQTYLPGQSGSFHGPATAGMWVLCGKGSSWTPVGASSAVTFAYDDADRLTTKTLPDGITQSYSYDDAGQVTGISYANGSNSLGNLTYGYDAAGRNITMGGSWARTGIPSAVSSASYDAANELTAWGNTALTHDANGNLTGDGSNTYTWNARDELGGVTGGVTATYGYDAFGRRTSATTGGTSTQYLLDGQNVVQELSGSTPTANLLEGGLNQYFSFTSGSEQSSLLTDDLGSTIALGTGSGTVQTQYTYDPFGATSTSGPASANPMQFAGMQNDGTGQYFDHARSYSPTLDRFTAQDPIGCSSAEANLYRYTNDSPLNAVDPTGLSPCGQAANQAADNALDSGLEAGMFGAIAGVTAWVSRVGYVSTSTYTYYGGAGTVTTVTETVVPAAEAVGPELAYGVPLLASFVAGLAIGDMIDNLYTSSHCGHTMGQDFYDWLHPNG
jgi:RHS repeat-associated protein